MLGYELQKALLESMSFVNFLFWKKAGRTNMWESRAPHSNIKLKVLQRKHFMSHRIVSVGMRAKNTTINSPVYKNVRQLC